VSSALAAPALAGIPVTHRGLAAAFVVVSGHAPSAYAPVLDGLPPTGVTVVVLMGFAARADIAARLLARGFAPDTPAALIVGAATPDSFRWLGTLAGLASADPGPSVAAGAPVLIVVGAVVSLAETLAPLAQAAGASMREAAGRGER
jgi:siroheme synthase